MTTATELDNNAQVGLEDDILSTPELTTPPVEPDAHRGSIIGVTSKTFESGSTAIVLSLQSSDAGFEAEYSIFPPTDFVENIGVNPEEISDEIPEGKKQSPKTRYAVVVANTTKDAELQRLRQFAADAGRSTAGMTKPTNFEEFVTVLNALLSGVELIFTRTADANAEDPAFRNRLKVNRLYPMDTMNKPKALKKYKKMWLEQ